MLESSATPPPPNPYNWHKHGRGHEIQRRQLPAILEWLREGMGVVIVAGRGMGKSVLLAQVRNHLANEEGVQVVRLSAPPPELSVQACLAALANGLGLPDRSYADARQVIGERLRQPDPPEHLILLYAELDGYARPVGGGSGRAELLSSPGRGFFNDLETARWEHPELGILAAGSIGVFIFRDVLGSGFLSRAKFPVLLSPFDREEIDALAQPFTDGGEALADEVLDALFLACGGNPALAAYGLQALWPTPSPGARDVTRAYARFKAEHSEFLQAVRQSYADPSLTRAAVRALELIRAANGKGTKGLPHLDSNQERPASKAGMLPITPWGKSSLERPAGIEPAS